MSGAISLAKTRGLKFQLTVDLDEPAFEGEEITRTAALLAELSRIVIMHSDIDGRIYDENGDAVGSWEIVR